MRKTICELFAGVVRIFEWAGLESGIDADVRENFDRYTADKIILLARYLLATDGASLTGFDAWLRNHPFTDVDPPLPPGLSCTSLFRTLGKNEDGREGFFASRAKRFDLSATIAYDSTTRTTGKVVRNVTFYSFNSREPVAYVRQSPRMRIMDAFEDALKRLQGLSRLQEDPLVVTALGGLGESYVAELRQRLIPFLTCVKPAKAASPVLVSNTVWAPGQARVHVRFRKRLEHLFADLKNTPDGFGPYGWPKGTIDGRQFVQFVALCYWNFLRRLGVDE